MTETADIMLALRLPAVTVGYFLEFMHFLHCIFLNLLEMLFLTLALYST